jgi:hypothetical protein
MIHVLIKDWRQLHNKDIYNLYSSLSVVKVIKLSQMRGAGHVERMGKMKSSYRILIEIAFGTRYFGSVRRKCEVNINKYK